MPLVAMLLGIMMLTALPLSAGADAIADKFEKRWGELSSWRPPSDWDSSMGMPNEFPGEPSQWNSFWRDYQEYRSRPIFTPSSSSMDYLQNAKIGNVKSWVNLRGGPSTDSDIVGRLDLGSSVGIDSWSIDGEWAYVIYNNYTQSAWVNGKYVVP